MENYYYYHKSEKVEKQSVEALALLSVTQGDLAQKIPILLLKSSVGLQSMN